jgi:hypothetical protein
MHLYLAALLAGAALLAQPTIVTVPTSSAIQWPRRVYVGPDGAVYFREAEFGIRKLLPDGGTEFVGGTAYDGGMVADGNGNLYFADYYQYRVFKRDAAGNVTLVAGNGTYSHTGDGGPATLAGVYGPTDVGLDAAGNLYIAEGLGYIRRVSPQGIITTIAGTGVLNWQPAGDGGPATQARFLGVNSIAVTPEGVIYIANPLGQRVRRIGTDGIITTVAGTGVADGAGLEGQPGTATPLWYPYGVSLDRNGELLIAEQYGGRIRRLSADGIIRTVAGNGTMSYSGDNGPPTLAGLNFPSSVSAAPDGSIYIADFANNRIRRVQGGPAVAPSVLESGAISLTGMTPTLTVRFSHTLGATNLDVVNILINRDLNGNNACYLAYSQPNNALYLVADGGPSAGLSPPLAPGTGSGAITNSQCAAYAAGGLASVSGTTLTLRIPLAFNGVFTGNKAVYLAARDRDGRSTGWVMAGAAAIPETSVAYPRFAGMTPAAGSTPEELLTFTFQGPNLKTAWVLMNGSISGDRSCYLGYSIPEDRYYLYPSSALHGLTSRRAADGGTLENSQCRLTLGRSSVIWNGSELQLRLHMTFSPYFHGLQGIWTGVVNGTGAGTGWVPAGAWLVPRP